MFEILENILNEVAPPGWEDWIAHRKEEHPDDDHSKWYAIAWAKHRRGENYTPGKKGRKRKPGKITGQWDTYVSKHQPEGKSIKVKAHRWDGESDPPVPDKHRRKKGDSWTIKTHAGHAKLKPGNWIVKSKHGYHPMNAGLFKRVFELHRINENEVPVNAASTGNIAGLVGDPPVGKKRKKLRCILRR